MLENCNEDFKNICLSCLKSTTLNSIESLKPNKSFLLQKQRWHLYHHSLLKLLHHLLETRLSQLVANQLNKKKKTRKINQASSRNTYGCSSIKLVTLYTLPPMTIQRSSLVVCFSISLDIKCLAVSWSVVPEGGEVDESMFENKPRWVQINIYENKI